VRALWSSRLSYCFNKPLVVCKDGSYFGSVGNRQFHQVDWATHIMLPLHHVNKSASIFEQTRALTRANSVLTIASCRQGINQ
jgi:hypothetical protein